MKNLNRQRYFFEKRKKGALLMNKKLIYNLKINKRFYCTLIIRFSAATIM
jgi:hypothetical protein